MPVLESNEQFGQPQVGEKRTAVISGAGTAQLQLKHETQPDSAFVSDLDGSFAAPITAVIACDPGIVLRFVISGAVVAVSDFNATTP